MNLSSIQELFTSQLNSQTTLSTKRGPITKNFLKPDNYVVAS